jgi:hypothetical protein
MRSSKYSKLNFKIITYNQVYFFDGRGFALQIYRYTKGKNDCIIDTASWPNHNTYYGPYVIIFAEVM